MPISADSPIMEVNQENLFELTPGEFAAMKMKTMSTYGIRDALELKQRMLEFVHIHSVDNTPTTMESLNRRFGKCAKQHGTDCLSIVRDLVAVDLLRSFSGRRTVVASSKVVDTIRKYAESETAYNESIEAFKSRAI